MEPHWGGRIYWNFPTILINPAGAASSSFFSAFFFLFSPFFFSF
jgi:hypothetical protein